MICLLYKIKGTMTWDEEGNFPQTESVQSTVGKFTQHLPNTTQKWGSQHLKGHKMYLLSIFLSLVYLIKTGILLCHLSGLSF